MGILKSLLFILLIVLPFGAIGRVHLFSSVYVNLFDVTIAFIFVVSVYYYVRLKKVHLYHAKWLMAFLLFGLLSLAINAHNFNYIEIGISFLYIVRIIIYANLMYVFFLFKRDFSSHYTNFLAFSGFSLVILGFLQYIFFQNLKPLFFLGWDDHLYRLFSTFLDPNFLGAYLVLVLLLLISIYFDKFHSRKIWSILLPIAILITLTSILLTYSRSTLIMLIVSVTSFLIITNRKKFLLYGGVMLLLAFLFIPRDYNIENMNPLRTASIIGRTESFRNAIKVFNTSPIYGVGFNTYRYTQRDLGLLDGKWEVTHAGAGVSNSYLFVLATTGIIGLILFGNFWIRVLKSVFQKRVERNKNIYLKGLVISSVLGVAVHSIFENTFFYPAVLIWIFILLGLWFVRHTQ